MESISRSGKVFTGKFAETAARIGLAKVVEEAPVEEVLSEEAPVEETPAKKGHKRGPKKTKK